MYIIILWINIYRRNTIFINHSVQVAIFPVKSPATNVRHGSIKQKLPDNFTLGFASLILYIIIIKHLSTTTPSEMSQILIESLLLQDANYIVGLGNVPYLYLLTFIINKLLRMWIC